jgi:8-amino-7-oxononanoate synthase
MERVGQFLRGRKEANLLRELRPAKVRKNGKIFIDGREYSDFSSNDYLGLSGHSALKEAAKKAIEEYGTSCSASRLLSGDMEITHELEEKTALLKQKEAALIFNSGYQANVGIIGCLCRAGDAIFSDRLNHASIIDGIRLSGARLFRYGHNDIEHLERLLKKSQGKFENRLIVTETIFSMDGDMAPLDELVGLKEKYNCMIMVDEAHATGIFGRDGGGLACEEGLAERIDLLMGTFGKALGSFGAYLACSRQMRQYLINAARSFVYSTALPAGVIAANLAALEIIKNEPFRRKRLLESADYFRGRLAEKGYSVIGQSQIVPMIVVDTEKAGLLSERLRKSGFWVLPIRPPTVPAGQARLRFSLSYCHDRDILEKLIEQIEKGRDV